MYPRPQTRPGPTSSPDTVALSLLLLPHVYHQTQNIMADIYQAASRAAKEYNVPLQAGANIAGFEKIARAMIAQGCV